MTTRFFKQYQPNIDGLRAMAVMAVIGFHFFPEIFPGGYVGVDVFFVISGYLITNLIITSIESRSFDLILFYQNRIKRIFPALLLVLACCFLLSWLSFFPFEFREFGKHISAATAFVPNFVYWSEIGYFNSGAETKPLLHLWSLGIEEQFYLFWPIILALTWRWKKLSILLIACTVIGSFLINIYYLRTDRSAAFFLPEARIWELGIGALYAVSKIYKPGIETLHKHHLSLFFAFIGFLLIVGSTLFLHKNSAYEGWWILLPTIGTILLLVSGEKCPLNVYLFSNSISIFIGKISYPLYLWHWPLLVYFRISANGNENLGSKFFLIILSFILASFTYFAIEQPIIKSNFGRKWVTSSILSMLLIGSLGWLAHIKYFKPRYSSIEIERFFAGTVDFKGESESIRRNYKTGNDVISVYGTENEKVLLIGDCHALELAQRFDRVISEHPANANILYLAIKSSCSPLMVKTPEYPGCLKFTEAIIDLAKDIYFETIIFAFDIESFFDGSLNWYSLETPTGEFKKNIVLSIEQRLQALRDTLSILKPLTKNLVLLNGIPQNVTLDPKHVIQRNVWNGTVQLKDIGVKKILIEEARNKFIPSLRRLTDELGIVLADSFGYFCPHENCQALNPEGKPMYSDSRHLSPEYARENFKLLDSFILPTKAEKNDSIVKHRKGKRTVGSSSAPKDKI